MHKGMLECLNAYDVPHVRVRGNVCKTNIVSNTAFRGFGAVQCMMIAETWMAHVIDATGLDANTVSAAGQDLSTTLSRLEGTLVL